MGNKILIFSKNNLFLFDIILIKLYILFKIYENICIRINLYYFDSAFHSLDIFLEMIQYIVIGIILALLLWLLFRTEGRAVYLIEHVCW